MLSPGRVQAKVSWLGTASDRRVQRPCLVDKGTLHDMEAVLGWLFPCVTFPNSGNSKLLYE